MSDASWGGTGSKNFANNTGVAGGSGGRTFLDTVITDGLLQRGTITSFKYLMDLSPIAQIRLMVFRPNGSNFDFVGESELFTPVSGSTQTKTLASPVTGVLPGDRLGVFMALDPGGTIGNGFCCITGGSLRYLDTHATGTSIDFTVHPQINDTLCLEAFGAAPDYVITGDSIPAGHGSNYNEFMGGAGPAGDRSAELLYQMEQANVVLNGQDYARGSQTFAWVDATAMPAILHGTGVHQAGSANPRAIVLWAGVNDIAAARTWTQVQTNLNSIYTQAGSIPLVIVDIIPDTNFNDTQAATVRTWNANIRTWASGKATVAVVTCHDLVGKNRVSTGQKDDLLYDSGDGVHLDAAGQAIVAPLVLAAVGAFFDTVAPSRPGAPLAAIVAVTERISWDASTDDQSSPSQILYNLYEDGGGTKIGSTAPGTTTYDVTHNLSDSHTYTVEAQDSVGNKSAKTDSITVNFAASSTPLSVSVVADGSGHPVLTWIADPNAVHYLILHSTSAQGEPTRIAVVAAPTLTYTDTGGNSGDYYAVVSTRG